MSAFKLEQFGGMLPAWDEHLLPAGQAADALNTYLFSGGLIGWRTPKLLHTLLNGATQFAYRIPKVTKGTASDTLTFVSNPNPGDQVTVGEITYTFNTTVTAQFSVLIGALSSNTAVNFQAALTLDNGANTNQGTLYGNGTFPNDDVDATGKTVASGNTVFVSAADLGAAYNTVQVAETTAGSRLSWATPHFTGGINNTFDPTITGNALWMEFLDADTNVVRSPVVDDKYDRYYMASPSLPPKYNTYDRIAANSPAWLLGVNPPGCAPLVSVTGGTNSATLGLPTATSVNTTSVVGNVILLIKVTSDSAVSLTDVNIMPASTDPTAYFAGVCYSDNNGVPSTLLGTGTTVQGCTAGTAVTSSFPNTVGFTTGTPYWIGMAIDSSETYQLADDLSNAGVVQQSNTFSNGPPETFTVQGGQVDIQMWADVTTGAVLESRAYVYTWVTEYLEESAPSPSTLANGWSNGIWDVTLWSPTPDDMGVERNIKVARVYRTVSDVSGQTVFYWVCDVDIATNTIKTVTTATGLTGGTCIIVGPGQIQDTIGDDVIALNLQLPSTTWFPPPAGLAGIYSMANGMLVGFRGNEIWFAEPYHPHAWPPSYVITTEFPIVGLGVCGTAVVAATGGTPYIAMGSSPATMALTKLPNAEPCISRGSIVATASSVYYSSQKGLIEVSVAGSATNTTELWITRDKWAELTPQKNLRAVLQSSCYFAFGTVNGTDNSVAQQGFTIELNTGDAQSFTIWPQPGGHRVGFSRLAAPNSLDIYNVFNDPWTGITLLIQNGGVQYYDFTDTAPLIQPYQWVSKIYQEKKRENYSAMRVFFTVPPNTPAQNAVRNTSDFDDPSWNTLTPGQYGIIYVYGDGNLITTREITANGELLRIASGQKFEQWQWKIYGRVLISNIQVATSVKELRNV